MEPIEDVASFRRSLALRVCELTLEEANAAAAKLCAHITRTKDGEANDKGVVVAVACTPKVANSEALTVTNKRLCAAIKKACTVDVEPTEDVVVPQTLVTDDELATAKEMHPPSWEEGQFADGTPNTPASSLLPHLNVKQQRLSDGLLASLL